MTKQRTALAVATASLISTLVLGSAATSAEGLKVFKDYVPSKEVYEVTLVKVKPNKIDDYLAGLKQTWADGCELGKRLGQVVDCTLLVSTTPGAQLYNVLLVICSPSAAIDDPDEARYTKFETEMHKKLAEDKQNQIVEGYEQLRTFVDQQNLRRIDFK